MIFVTPSFLSLTSASGESGLFLDGGDMSSTLRSVEDYAGTNSPLQLSTSLVKIDSNLIVGSATSASARLHVSGDGTNPIARFESSAGTEVLRVTHNGGIQGGSSAIWIPPIVTPLTTGAVKFGVQAANNAWLFEGGGNTSYHLGVIGYSGFGATSGTVRSIQSTSSFEAGAGSANYRPIEISYTINASGAQTGTATGIFLNATETALNGMTHNLLTLQTGGVNRFSVSNGGWARLSSFVSISNENVTMASYGSGQLTLFNNAFDGFNRINFGGTTNLFPALKRNGAALEARLADDSEYADLNLRQLTSTLGRIFFNASGTVLQIAGVGSPEGVVTANVGSLYMRTDGGAGTSFYVKESGTGNTGWVAK